MRRDGTLAYVREGRRVRFPEAAVEAYLREQWAAYWHHVEDVAAAAPAPSAESAARLRKLIEAAGTRTAVGPPPEIVERAT